MYDCPWEICELKVAFQSCDLSVCKKMIVWREASVPDQVVRSRKSYKVI